MVWRDEPPKEIPPPDLERIKANLALSIDERARRGEESRRKRYGRPPLNDGDPTPLEQVCGSLLDAGVEFVLIGSQAAVLRGADLSPADIDICHSLSPGNRKRLAAALERYDLWSQEIGDVGGAMPLSKDAVARETEGPVVCVSIDNDIGLDFAGNIPIVGPYERLIPGAERMTLGGRSILVQGLDDQIECLRQIAVGKYWFRARTTVQLEAIRELLRARTKLR